MKHGGNNIAVIGVGSNIEPEKNVMRAKAELCALFEVLKESVFFYTKPLLYQDQADFLNGAVLISTDLDVQALDRELKLIEAKLGRERDRQNKNGPRTIDLDILIYNEDVVDSDVYERDFLRKCLGELLPEFVIPPPE